MNISDEQLAAHLDGELGAEDKAAVAAAIAADPQLARQIAAQQALRERVRQAFDRTLDEPIPQELLDAVQGAPIVDLKTARARRRRLWPATTLWFTAAASLVLAALMVPRLLHLASDEPNLVTVGSNRSAAGELARALSLRLASEPPSGHVRLSISFVAKSGEYCRTFIEAHNEHSVAGLACRERDSWRVHVLEPISASAGEGGDYRQAASALPPLVLQAVETRMAGEPLDATGEAKARDGDWKPTLQRTQSQPAD
jgi:hypothetical protein